MTESSTKLFCSRPFQDLEVTGFSRPKGDCYMCCPAWLDQPIGNILKQPFDELWNSQQAQAIRASIHDGSFSYCNAELCPFLKTVTGPVQPVDKVTDPRLREIIENELIDLKEGPSRVNCSYDQSCNLVCPTCRPYKIVETESETDILAIQATLEQHFLGSAKYLYITGSGDAFGSKYFNRWLRTMKLEHMPQLNTIHIHSNGQLWTPSMWERLPPNVRSKIRSAEISIDAASPATYAINRAPGTFDRLLENLAFIKTLREQGPLEYLKISMVVQDNNVHEMADFVALGKQHSVDVVYFGRLVNWGTFNNLEFVRRAVHRRTHLRHKELLQMINHPIMRDPVVFLGNLRDLSTTHDQVHSPA